MKAVSMTSKEIAEVTGKRHCDVLRDARVMLKQLYGDDANLRHEQIQGLTMHYDGRGYLAYIELDKMHTFTLVSGYDAKLRMAAVQYIDKLEAQLRIDPQVRSLPAPQADASLLFEVIQSLSHAAQVDLAVRLYDKEKAAREVAQEHIPSNEYCRMYRETKAREDAERRARKVLAQQPTPRRRRPMDS